MTSKPAIRIFIVDDHTVVRQGTREMLMRYPAFTVVGESDSGNQLEGELLLKKPQLLLLDINLPGKNGLQLLEEIKPRLPELKVILFSAHNESQYIRKAQTLRADGYLNKTIEESALVNAILEVMEGSQALVFSPDLAEKFKENDHSGKKHLLTPREQEILAQLSQGFSNQEIGKNLCLSVKTVDTHIANIMKKTGLNRRTQLLAYAYENGLL